MSPDNEHNENNRFRGIKPETEEKYRQAMELYRSRRLSCAEISRICKVTVSGFQCYLSLYHRDLLLARYNENNFTDFSLNIIPRICFCIKKNTIAGNIANWNEFFYLSFTA